MDILKDLKLVYLKTVQISKDLIIKNPIVLFLPIIFTIILNYLERSSLSGLLFYNSLLGSLIYALIYSAIMSIYFSVLSDLVYFGRIKIQNIFNTRNFSNYLFSIYFVVFVYSWVSLFSSNFYLLGLILYIIFNPIAESIYIKDKQYIESFTYTLNFMKENILHWILLLIVYGILSSLILSPNVILESVSRQDYINISLGFKTYLPSLNNTDNLIRYIIFYLLTGVYIVFRASLYNILSKSTLRKRKYMGSI